MARVQNPVQKWKFGFLEGKIRNCSLSTVHLSPCKLKLICFKKLSKILKQRYLYQFQQMLLHVVVFSFPLFVVVPRRMPHLSFNNKYPGVDSINISIHPIPEEYHNGKLLGYHISYETSCYGVPKLSDHVNVSASTRSFILTGLRPGTKYNIQGAGFTSKGVGPYDWQDAYTSKQPFVGIVIFLV